MNLMVVAGMVICLLSISAAAYTGASLSTNSYLWTDDSENSVLRSLWNDKITVPDLEMITQSEITSEVNIEGGGSSAISQSASLAAKRDEDGFYSLIASLSSSASGSGVSELKSTINFQGSSKILDPWGDINSMNKVDVDLLGLAMASPGSDDYVLYTDFNYNVLTNVPILVVSDKWRPVDPDLFKISMVVDDTEFDEPMDYIDQDIDVHFATNGYDFMGGYDFSRTIENDDMAFSSEMTYINSGVID